MWRQHCELEVVQVRSGSDTVGEGSRAVRKVKICNKRGIKAVWCWQYLSFVGKGGKCIPNRRMKD